MAGKPKSGIGQIRKRKTGKGPKCLPTSWRRNFRSRKRSFAGPHSCQIGQITCFRVFDPDQVQQFAQTHDERLWQCLCQLLGIHTRFAQCRENRFQGQWQSSAMIEARHPEVAAQVIAQPNGHTLRAVVDAAGVRVFLNFPIGGDWPPVCVFLATKKSKSQGGSTKRPPGSNRNIGKPSDMSSHSYQPCFVRVLLLRRCPLPCGRPLDSCGHHRAACARPGVLGRRGSLWKAAARICRGDT